jgi:hypothetical protein
MPEPEPPLPDDLAAMLATIDRLHTLKHVRSERCRECHQRYPCHARMVLDVLQRHRGKLDLLARTILNGGTIGG